MVSGALLRRPKTLNVVERDRLSKPQSKDVMQHYLRTKSFQKYLCISHRIQAESSKFKGLDSAEYVRSRMLMAYLHPWPNVIYELRIDFNPKVH